MFNQINSQDPDQSHYYYILELDTSKKRKLKSYGFSIWQDQWDILEILKQEKMLTRKSDGLRFCIDYAFQVGSILLKYSDANFIMTNPNDWSDQDYNLYFDNMQKIQHMQKIVRGYFKKKE